MGSNIPSRFELIHDGWLKIVKALGKRGLRGFYFSCSQYKELVGIAKLDDAKDKIVAWGFHEVQQPEDSESLVDALQSFRSTRKQDKGLIGYMIADPLFWLLPGFIGCSGRQDH